MTLVPDACSAARMTARDAQEVAKMMASEDESYMSYFTPFAAPLELLEAFNRAENDIYMALRCNGASVGFYMLRGWDEGYKRPSFGVYVGSLWQGRGIAKFALRHAEAVCRSIDVKRIMLKVSLRNKAALSVYKGAGFEVLSTCDVTGNIIMEKVLRG